MHGHPDLPEALAKPVAEFALIIRHYRIDQVLLRRHYLRLAVGLTASAGVIAYNLFHPHAVTDLELRRAVAAWLVVSFLGFCLLAMGSAYLREQARLRQAVPSLRLRVMQVVDVVHRGGNLLLFLTAIGHGVVLIGTLIGLDLFTRDGRVLLGALVPVVMLCVHSLTQIPTVQKLCAIYAGILTPPSAS